MTLKRALIVFIITAALCGATAGVQTVRLSQLQKTYDAEVTAHAAKNVEMQSTRETMEKQQSELQAKYDKLHALCVKLDAVDTRNQSDLYKYIRAKYRRTPDILAKLIGEKAVSLSKEHQMPFELAVGMMEVESAFNPTLVSKAHARGLMQVRWKDWGAKLKEVGLTTHFNLHEVDQGILAGIIAFQDCLDRSKDVEEALWRYNGTNGKKGVYSTQVYTAMGEFSVFRAMMRHEAKSKGADDGEQTTIKAPVVQGKGTLPGKDRSH